MLDEVERLIAIGNSKLRGVSDPMINRCRELCRADPHEPNRKPCLTCQAVTTILSELFWCMRVSKGSKQ